MSVKQFGVSMCIELPSHPKHTARYPNNFKKSYDKQVGGVLCLFQEHSSKPEKKITETLFS